MVLKIVSLLCLFGFLAYINSSLAKRETNASRLSRGLPPLPPRFLSRDVTATANPRPSTSPIPKYFSGRIQVRTGNGKSLGYVRNAASNTNSVNTLGRGEDLRVKFIFGREPFEIIATVQSKLPPTFYIGAQENNQLAIFFSTPTSSKVINSSLYPSIRATNKFPVHYLNPDGTKSSVVVAFNAHDNELFFVHDINAHNTRDLPALAVKLFLVEA
ncbi:hypothetical protein C8J57DRAFT_1297773 [Mycena rebaudengoi]|nr:hypothetical protein C8J57DRAFT_1297773 [Mycena rebaudengoi]